MDSRIITILQYNVAQSLLVPSTIIPSNGVKKYLPSCEWPSSWGAAMCGIFIVIEFHHIKPKKKKNEKQKTRILCNCAFVYYLILGSSEHDRFVFTLINNVVGEAFQKLWILSHKYTTKCKCWGVTSWIDCEQIEID